jgi:hypothetical protein
VCDFLVRKLKARSWDETHLVLRHDLFAVHLTKTSCDVGVTTDASLSGARRFVCWSNTQAGAILSVEVLVEPDGRFVIADGHHLRDLPGRPPRHQGREPLPDKRKVRFVRGSIVVYWDTMRRLLNLSSSSKVLYARCGMLTGTGEGHLINHSLSV